MNTQTEKLGPARYDESLAKMIWLRQDLLSPPLRTEEGCAIKVEFPGVPNPGSGPDFLGAHIWIEGKLLSGDVEIHVEPHMWYDHGHQHDPLYSGVILHATLRRGKSRDCTRTYLGNTIPILVLEPHLKTAFVDVAAFASLPKNGSKAIDSETEALILTQGEIRMLAKIDRARSLVATCGFEEALYRQVMTALGYRHNKAQFLQLASIVPYSTISKLTESEARQLLIHAAGFAPAEGHTQVKLAGVAMQKEFWHTRGVRPMNHPIRRIEAAAAIFTGGQIEKILDYACLSDGVRETFLDDISQMIIKASRGTVGNDRALEIVINVVIPFAFARGASHGIKNIMLLKIHAPPYITRMCDEIGLNYQSLGGESTLGMIFGIIHWHTNLLSRRG